MKAFWMLLCYFGAIVSTILFFWFYFGHNDHAALGSLVINLACGRVIEGEIRDRMKGRVLL